jgi:hypothetical protein
MSRSRLAVTVVVAALAVTACSVGKQGPSDQASGAPAKSGTPQSTPTPEETEIPNGTMSDDFVIVRRLEPTAGNAFAVFLAGNSELVFSVPDGATSHGFRDIASAEVDGNATTVRFLSGEGGEIRAQQHLDGAWQLPTMGVAKRAVGMSADGSTIVLERPQSSSRKSTSFAVVKASGAHAVRVLTFPGDLSFDALSPDGSWLYVLAHRAGGSYEVHRASLATGALDPGVIVDKRNPGEVMAGYAITQVTSGNGWVYTLYQGPEGPFVHALSTNDGAALCIDLPKDDKAVADDATAAAWGLALSPDRQSLFAANSALGTVSELSLDDFTVKQTKALSDKTGAVELAKFENGKWNDAGSVAVSPDSKVVYVGGPHGVSAIGAADFKPIATLGGDRGYRSLAVGDTGQVYAIDAGGALHRLGSADDPADTTLATDGMALIEGVLTVGG